MNHFSIPKSEDARDLCLAAFLIGAVLVAGAALNFLAIMGMWR